MEESPEEKFKRLFRQYLKNVSLSQKELARKLACREDALSRWLSGERPWPAYEFEQACQLLALSSAQQAELKSLITVDKAKPIEPRVTLPTLTQAWDWAKLGPTLARQDKAWEKVDWQEAVEAYRQDLLRQHRLIKPLGMSSPISLETIYVAVNILDKVTAYQRYSMDKLLQHGFDRDHRSDKTTRIDGLELVKRETSQRLFIFGKPGAGKSTFLKYLTVQAVKHQIAKVPILVNMKEWSTQKQPLMVYLGQQFALCDWPSIPAFLELLLKTGQVLVLFDGLDEVNVENQVRARLIAEVHQFCRLYPANQYLVTCRLAANEYAWPDFQEVELADFEDEQIKQFVKLWFSQAESKHEAFLSQFYHDDNKPIRELGHVPILLTLLCLAFDDSMSFPRRRADLYEEALDALLRKWDSFRSIHRDPIYQGLDRKLKMSMLAQIAYENFEKGEYFVPERRLAAQIETFLQKLPPVSGQSEPDGLQILQAIEAQHGLLTARAHQIYSFSHLTFHEYFTAKYIADNEVRGTVEHLMSHLTDSRWREVFLLTANLLGETNEFFVRMQLTLARFISKDKTLKKLLLWADSKAQSSRLVDASLLRYIYFSLAWVYALSYDSAFDLVDKLVFHQANPSELADAFNYYFVRFIVVKDNGCIRNLVPKWGYRVTIDFVLRYAWQRAILFAKKAEDEYVTDWQGYVRQYSNFWQELLDLVAESSESRLLIQLQAMIIPPETAPQNAWAELAEQLQHILVAERNMRFMKSLTDWQQKQLKAYFEANDLMLKCLDVALIHPDRRAAIRAGMFAPPRG